MRSIIGFAAIILAEYLSLGVSGARVIYVAKTGSGADGQSWFRAYRRVMNAMDVAQGGDEIWVARGLYVERVTLRNGVALYGGFVGSETLREQRDWASNFTLLDANGGGSVVSVNTGGPTTRIDGFYIRNGSASFGGGIYCGSSSSPTITNNTITSNITANNGGGIYCGSSSSPTISNNTITSNRATSDGGGIYCGSSSSPTISNNTISGNSANNGGGIYCSAPSFPTIADNTVTSNNASANGGGIRTVGSNPDDVRTFMIVNNTITGNSAGNGGGISCDFVSPVIATNTITGNSAVGDGGGICCVTSSPVIANNTVAHNRADSASSRGGGVFCDRSFPWIASNTVASNSANNGGGIHCRNSSPTIANTVVAFNSSGIDFVGGAPALDYNCVYGNTAYDYAGLSAGAYDLILDPLFVDRANGDYRLLAASPCVNAGDNTSVPGWLTTDLAGNPRIRGGRVDIGAYEFGIPGDANRDGCVDDADLTAVVLDYDTPGGANGVTDANEDGIVDDADITIVILNFGSGC